MKSTLTHVLFFSIILSFSAQAQQAIALRQSNYGGVLSLHTNPSSVADSRYTTYINFLNIDAHSVNNFYQNQNFSLYNSIKNGFSLQKNTESFNARGNFLSTGIDIKGLSLLQNINKRNAFAISTRLRGTLQANSVSTNFYDLIARGNIQPNVFKNEKLNVNAQLFHEIGLTYGAVLINNGEYFLKAGVTLKLLTGIYNVGVTGKNINGQTTTNDLGKEALDFESGNLNVRYLGSQNLEKINPFALDFNNIFNKKVGNGFGGDLGFTYEFRPDYKDNYIKRRRKHKSRGVYANLTSPIKYKLRVGLALVDFGKIRYSSDSIKSYDIDLKDKKFGSETDGNFKYQNILNLTKTPISDFKQAFSASIPTTLQLNADYKIADDIFVNFSAQQNLVSKTAVGSRYASYLALSPRWETQHFEAALPIIWGNNYKTLMVGTALRIGPLMLGTDNIWALSSIGQKSSGANIYAGLHLGFGAKKENPALAAKQLLQMKQTQKIIVNARKKRPKMDGKNSAKSAKSDDEEEETTSDMSGADLVKKSAKMDKPESKKPLDVPKNDQIEKFDKCISFYYNQATLTSGAYTCLGEMCKLYTANKKLTLKITGCILETENAPDPEKLKLSRARAIRNYLIQSGFKGAQITIFADKRPNGKNAVIFMKE